MTINQDAHIAGIHNPISLRCLVILFVLPIMSLDCLFAQDEPDVDFQTWMDYNLSVRNEGRWSFGGDAGFRGVLSGESWNTMYIRPSAKYKPSLWFSAVGGLGNFNTFDKELSNTYEIRLFQDANFRWPDFGYVITSHRVRFEQRLFIYPDMPSTFSVRGRYMIAFETTDFSLFTKKRQFYLKASWELFVPFDDDAVERYVNNQRITAIFGHRINAKYRWELDYTWQNSRQLSTEGFETSENILRLRFFHTISKPKKQEG